MGKNKYKEKDYWSLKATKEGYPARSVYKLIEIDEKFNLIKESKKILDLGAAPGSWTSYILKKLNGTGFLTAIDLSELKIPFPSKNFIFFQGDLCSLEIQKKTKNNGPYDLIVSDAAPATTGNKIVDASRSEQLVEIALHYAKEMLTKGGSFVVKIFQGQQQQIQTKMREVFNVVKIAKPKACRMSSFEIYFVGLDKK